MKNTDRPAIPIEVTRGGPAPVGAARRVAIGTAEVIRHALLGAVPVLGGAIDAAVSEVERQRTEAGRDELLRQLARMLDRVDERKVDAAYLETQEFQDQFATTWRLSERTRDKAKIRLYAAILAGSASLDRARFLEPESILPVLAELSPGDLFVLHDLWLKGRAGGMAYTYRRADEDPALPLEVSRHLVFHLFRLERSGLVKQDSDVHDAVTGDAFSPTITLFSLMELVGEIDGNDGQAWTGLVDRG
jgi:hypothetical protein